ncbi:hypothetical protein ACFYTS_29720 [Nocardia sp. NPDC004151]|uniref:hypothetical protein n=1 Tax=Nocardia sp. NPDC004151 TaxID=3364304 RepID=UPI0036C74BC0
MSLLTPTAAVLRRNPLVASILEDLPGFKEAASVQAKASEMLAEVQREMNDAAKGIDTSSVIESGVVPDSWLADVGAKMLKKRIAQDKYNITTELRNDASAKLDMITFDAIPGLLDTLAARLAGLVGDLEALIPDLNGAKDPRQAIDLDSADVWRKIQGRADEYKLIRQAQAVLTSEGDQYLWGRNQAQYSEDPNASLAVISNIDEVWNRWDTQEARDGAPWPEDTTEFLVWAIRNGARFWLPSPDELAQAEADRKQAMRDEAARIVAEVRRDQNYLNGRYLHPFIADIVRNQVWV